MASADGGGSTSGMLDFQSVLVEEIDNHYIANNYPGRALTNCVLTATTVCDVLKKLDVQASIIFVSLYVCVVRRGADVQTGEVARLNIGEEGVAPPHPGLAPYHCVVLIRDGGQNVLYDPSFLQAYTESELLRPYVPQQEWPKFNLCQFSDSRAFRNFRNCAGNASSVWNFKSGSHYLYCHYVPHRKAAQKQHFRRSPDALIVRRKAVVANILRRYGEFRNASVIPDDALPPDATVMGGAAVEPVSSERHSCG